MAGRGAGGRDGGLALAGLWPRLSLRMASGWSHSLQGFRASRMWETALADFRLEQERGAGMLVAPIPLCMGAAAYFLVPFEPGWLWLGGLAACLAVLLPFVPRGGQAAWALWLAAFLALGGAGAAKLETVRADTRVLGSEVSTRLTARVVAIDRQASGRTRLTLDLLATERPQLRYAPHRVRATARNVPEALRIGMTVRGVVRLMPPSGPAVPGGYDFSFESYFDGIGANGFFLVGPELVGGDADTGWSSRVENLRDAIARRIGSVIGGAEGAVAAALVVGVRAAIPEAVNEDLRKTGLAHVLSISGLHMALVAGCVMGSLRAALALLPHFSSRRATKKFAAAGALATITFYLLLSGADVAAQRSFLMLAIMLAAVLFDRAALSMRNVALSALALILWSPHEVMGPSFQMSFAATAALVAAYGWWARRGSREARRGGTSRAGQWAGWCARALLGLAATSLIAGLATLVFGAYHFQRIAPLGLFANLAAMPLVSVLVMPFSVLGMVLMPLGLDAPCWLVVGAGLRAVLAIAHWLAAYSPLDAVGMVGTWVVIAAAGAIAVIAAASTRLVLLALLPLVWALTAQSFMRPPDLLIAEDGRLAALRTPEGNLAVNQPRGRSFLLRSWEAASASASVIRPSEALAQQPSLSAPDGRFACSPLACVSQARTGALVAIAHTAATGADFCEVEVLVVAEAGAKNPCTASQTRPALFLSARDLARRGAAAIWLDGDTKPIMRQAIGEPFRPWHAHRRYSRAARGMAERPRGKQRQALQGEGAATPSPNSN